MIQDVIAALNREFRRHNRVVLGLFLLFLVALNVVLYLLYTQYWELSAALWLREMLVANAVLLFVSALFLFAFYRLRLRLVQTTAKAIGAELHQLRAANDRARSLQMMASTLSATLSFERVVEQALDVCSLALEDMGVPRETLLGAVFLYDGAAMVPLARRRFLPDDEERALPGESGVVGASLEQAEPTVTDNPALDPELREFATFRNCLTVVSVPLRAGFQLFGIMVIGTDTAVRFEEEHFDLFTAVADQAVIALQNAQLYQNLEAEKQRLIAANEEARRELARDLHDGPVQKVAAVSMRLSVIRPLVQRDPQRAEAEIKKLDELVKRTSSELRSMLFTLRPLVLETQGLGAAIETVMDHVEETYGIETELIGGENGRLLSQMAQGVVFSIVEEALSNARKHASPRRIEVRLWCEGAQSAGENGAHEEAYFIVRVHDDGVGFDVDEVMRDYSSRNSLGMLNMRERAERIDGSLSIESAPATGTAVTLAVPLQKYGRGQDAPLLETAEGQ